MCLLSGITENDTGITVCVSGSVWLTISVIAVWFCCFSLLSFTVLKCIHRLLCVFILPKLVV